MSDAESPIIQTGNEANLATREGSMRFFLSILAGVLILYVADAAFASGKYSKGVAAMGKSMAMHFGLSMRR
jgi:hypothetical protein